MRKVIVASLNPVKVAVAKRAFTEVFPDEVFDFIATESDSGVPDQPYDDETKQGAANRLAYVREKYPEADFWVSQEGGVHHDEERLYSRAWMMVADASGYTAESSTAQYYLPKKVVELLNEGLELGHAIDSCFGSANSKHGMGAIGFLTDGVIDRESYYTQAAIVALSEIKHKDWYL